MSPPDEPSPRPLLDKLGVVPGHRVCVLGFDDPAFVAEVRSRSGAVAVDRLVEGSDVVFVWVDHRGDLDEALAPLEGVLARDGVIWVLRPKGRTGDIRETDVIDAGKRWGFVDNKIASFSQTVSAMRLVIPLVRR